MPSFSDSIFLFVLALLLFGPKKLPILARELGKWVGEFRRASNEFKMQMEEELRQSEQAERLKKIEAIEAAAPPAPTIPAMPTAAILSSETSTESTPAEPTVGVSSDEPAPSAPAPEVIPIAEAGELKIMPPSTGLPTPRRSALSGLLDAIPSAENGNTHNGTSNNGSTHNEDAETVHGN